MNSKELQKILIETRANKLKRNNFDFTSKQKHRPGPEWKPETTVNLSQKVWYSIKNNLELDFNLLN